jgi:hypothetical protein
MEFCLSQDVEKYGEVMLFLGLELPIRQRPFKQYTIWLGFVENVSGIRHVLCSRILNLFEHG